MFPLVALPRHIDLPGALKRLHDINADLITTLQRSATAAAGSCGKTTSQSDASDKQFSFGAYCLMNWVDTQSAGFVSTDEGSVVNAAASLEVVQGLLWRMDRNEVLNAGEGEETPTPTAGGGDAPTPTASQSPKPTGGAGDVRVRGGLLGVVVAVAITALWF